MRATFLLTLVALPVLIILDLTWTAGLAQAFYRTQLGYLMTAQVQILPLILFYLIYSFGIAYFVVVPAVRAHSWSKLHFSAALLGLIGYGTYDLVNLGVIAHWPLVMSIVDILWGIVISILTASATYAVAIKVFRW